MCKTVLISHLVKVPAKIAMSPPVLRKAEGGSVTFCPCLQCVVILRNTTQSFPAHLGIVSVLTFQLPFFYHCILAKLFKIKIIYSLFENWIDPQALSTFVIFAPLFPSAKTEIARRLPSHLKSISKQEQRQMAELSSNEHKTQPLP